MRTVQADSYLNSEQIDTLLIGRSGGGFNLQGACTIEIVPFSNIARFADTDLASAGCEGGKMASN
jgi:hypothetical protein